MMRGLSIIGILVLGFLIPTTALAQKADTRINTTLPKVFLIGEQPDIFEELNKNYEKLLLEICGDDMNLAYNKWLDMLQAMEQHATNMGFDIRGVKMWLKVFWDKDGNIKHIAYHLKQDSKNVRTKYLSAFFRDFMKNYKTVCKAEGNFSQYSTASFPTIPQRVQR